MQKNELKVKRIMVSTLSQKERRRILFEIFDILFSGKYSSKEQQIKCQQKKDD